MEYSLVSIIKCHFNYELFDKNDKAANNIVLELGSWNEKQQNVILHFWEFGNGSWPHPNVHEIKESITIDLPITYFERLYPLLQDSFINLKTKVKLTLTRGESNDMWNIRFESVLL